MHNPFGKITVACSDGVDTCLASAADLQEYGDAACTISQMKVPQFLRGDQPNEHIIFCFFDGTENDGGNPEMGCDTAVYKVYRNITESRYAQKSRIHLLYLNGPGTQKAIGRRWDLLRGYTFKSRADTMYKLLIETAKKIVSKSPQNEIRIVVMGFSRGAEQAAYFSRLIHNRGLHDFNGTSWELDAFTDLVVRLKFTKDQVRAPATVPQAAVLLDPVPTGSPKNFDRRLPPSVVSALQMRARDERRNAFVDSRHLQHGFSFRSRCFHLTLAGAHCDIGDAYFCRGLGVRATNLVRRYLNGLMALSGVRLNLEPEPQLNDPMNVIHRSEQHKSMRIGRGRSIRSFSISKYRDEGRRKEIKRLAPGRCSLEPCYCHRCSRMPIDEILANMLDWRNVP